MLTKHDLKRVKIGLIHSLTGTMALSERSLLDAERLAIDEINDQGGVLGCRIDPTIVDGASVPETFAEQARVALSSGVDTLFGCWTSSSRKAVKPLVEASDGLLWYPVQYEGLEESKHICYTGSCLNQQITPAVQWLLENVGDRVFLLGSDYVFPRTANQLIRSLVEHQGGSILGEQYVELGSQDFAAVIDQVRRERPCAVFNTLNGDSNTWFYQQYRAAGIRAAKIPIMAVSVGETELAPIVDAAQGHLACWSYFQSLENVENRLFVARFRERYGTDRVCSDPMVMAYSQIYLWKEAVALAGSFAPGAVRRWLVGCGHESPAGPITIHANHHVSKHAYVGRLAGDGQFEIEWCSEQPIEPLPWLGLEELELPAKTLIKRSMAAFPEVVYSSSILEREVRERGRLEEALRRSNDELEAQVRERTEELNGAVRKLQIEIDERKQADQALRLARFSIDFASDFTLWISPGGRILDVSQSACARLGYSRDEFLTMSIFDVTVGLSSDTWPDRWRELKQGSLIFEKQYRTKDGEIFPVEISSTILEHESREYNLAIIRDITERKQAEASLRMAQFSVDHAADSVVWIGLDGRYVDVNPSVCARLGYSRDELLTKSVFDITEGLSAEAWPDRWREIKEHGPVTFEKLHRAKDGEVFPVEIISSILEYEGREYLLGIIRDVTVRKQAAEELEQSHHLLENLARLVPGVIYQYRLYPDGRSAFPYSSPGINDIYEVTPEEVREDATLVFGRLHPDDYDRVADSIQESARTLQTFLCEFRVLLPRQGLRWRWSQAHPERAADGGTLWHGIISDITERKESEQALRQTEEQLRQSQKMEAVGQLAGGIAHDFNNLLTAVLGYSDLLLARPEIAASEAREDLEEIKHAAERASALTRQILAFSRRQALRPRVVSLNEILTGMEPLLRRTLGEDIELLSLQDPGLGNAEADIHQFEQVIMNLALNARDAMVSGGRLTLETGNVELDEEYCRTHAGAAPGSYVMLSVSDTGAGMDEITRERIFEPFFTTKAPGAGTGLGLSTVYGIVKQSGGSIFVRSEPGKGTKFKIYLPRVTTAPEQIPLVSGRVSNGGAETILLVEDEVSLRSLATRVLGGLGYHVLGVGTAEEALQAVSELDRQLDLLLTDVVLPGPLQGNDLARMLISFLPGLPVLYMSGYTRDAIVHAGRLDPGVNFLEKPFTPEALAGMVRTVLDQPRVSR